LAKKKNKQPKAQAAPQRHNWLWAIAAVALVLVAGSLVVLLTSPGATSETGSPKVVVEQPVIDEGYQKLNDPIRTSFTLHNEGDAPLQILDEPLVELVEGC
jgi:hypothetical protein